MAKIFVKCITKDTPQNKRVFETVETVWHETYEKTVEIFNHNTVIIENTELKIIGMQAGLSGGSLAYVCDAAPLKNGHYAYVLYTDLPWIDIQH